MKKKNILVAFLALFLLPSCAKNIGIDPTSEESYVFASGLTGEINEIRLNVGADFGNYRKNEVTFLLGDSLIPFPDYYFVPGDYALISYRGDWVVEETYPSRIKTELIEIVRIWVFKGLAMGATVIDGGNGDKVFKMDDYDLSYPAKDFNVILEDGGYRKGEEYGIGSKIYGVNPAILSSYSFSYFFSYDPSLRM
ncbi:MAG: hypothetical protein K6B65_03370 [Bacilli bacterium]|nr:hypothetical protein [Bacilli bacterium]